MIDILILARKLAKPVGSFVEVFATVSIGLLVIAGLFWIAVQLMAWWLSQPPVIMLLLAIATVALFCASISVWYPHGQPEKKKNDD